MLGEVVAELAGDLADVVGVGDQVVVGETVGVGVPGSRRIRSLASVASLMYRPPAWALRYSA